MVRAANRATVVRAAGDMIADIKMLPPTDAYPVTRALLESYADNLADRLSGHDATGHPITEELPFEPYGSSRPTTAWPSKQHSRSSPWQPTSPKSSRSRFQHRIAPQPPVRQSGERL